MTNPRPRVDHVLTRLRQCLGAGTSLLVVTAVAVSASMAAHPWGASAVGAGAAVLLALSTGWTTGRALASEDAPVGWIAGGYLLKAAIVIGSLVVAREWDLGQRWTGLWVVAAVAVCSGSEVVVLSRARVAAVDRPASGKAPGS